MRRPRPDDAPTATTSGADPARQAALRRKILTWGEANRRDLPWRATRRPWDVLVSEFMLQQTQASRVVDPYVRFVAAFPSPASCAAAGAPAVVRAWEGLGYNRRALNLHRAAEVLVARHGGEVPADLDALRVLPGVGPYTARAVLCFAFEDDTGVVDTNVARLLARAVAGRPLRAAEAQEVADDLVPSGRSWSFNQALFDLGALHCTARRPDCAGCPLARSCAWARSGWAAPDPSVGSAGVGRGQSPFDGSDRQGRGRLVDALRRGPLAEGDLASAAGWSDDAARARRVSDGLVAEGFARWERGRLRLC
ncbi:MAG: A/G-specific adenine glycosylase [Acidimicrobiales bacterium]